MLLRIVLLISLLTVTQTICAAQQLVLSFKLVQGYTVVVQGEAIVTHNADTWSKGLLRSYLRLSCVYQESGEVQKSYSTLDHFSGFQVKHQLVDDHVELEVVRSIVKPRLAEIRALKKSKCMDISPVVVTTTQSYRIPVIDKSKVIESFDAKTTFQVTLQPIGILR